mgnify:CR=1 FL=1
MVISKNNALVRHWGKASLAYQLCSVKNLSVKHEVMAPFDSEVMHYHVHTVQCFFILKGSAQIMLDDITYTLNANDSITVMTNVKHCIKNCSDSQIEFLVISQPEISTDRIEL